MEQFTKVLVEVYQPVYSCGWMFRHTYWIEGYFFITEGWMIDDKQGCLDRAVQDLYEILDSHVEEMDMEPIERKIDITGVTGDISGEFLYCLEIGEQLTIEGSSYRMMGYERDGDECRAIVVIEE